MVDINSELHKELEQRGFISQSTDPETIPNMIKNNPVTIYAGFDPTADSLHVGHLIPIMALGHFLRAGHKAIALIGTGTAMVGDPSGKTEMRKMLTKDQIIDNATQIKKQLTNILPNENAIFMENGEWLLSLAYIDFLRDVGRHFSVNRMLTAESYKLRMEKGLSFIEFNYQILQAYDFWQLFKQKQCTLQIGGDDQWGNIVAGIDLVRRLGGPQTYGLTFPLLTTASGQKMGKTEGGALWLDPKRTTPYEYYQYWVNTDDRDVAKFLYLFTYLPINQIKEVESLEDSQLNLAKIILAFEATKICHGHQEAVKAQEAAQKAFGAREIPKDLISDSQVIRKANNDSAADIPTTKIDPAEHDNAINIVDLLSLCALTPSKSAARRLVKQGGSYVDGERINGIDYSIDLSQLSPEGLVIRAGKKKYHRICLKR